MRHLSKGVLYDRLCQQPEKKADASRRHRWFPCELTSEKRVKIFYANDVSIPRSGYCF